MTLKKTTSILTDSVIPHYIRGNPEFDAIRQFMTSYFESLEQPGAANDQIVNAREYADIDTTTPEYIDRFFAMFCPDLSPKVLTNKTLLLKHARELYAKKGTPESFKLLFRILFNEDVTVKYPNESILKASDGIWDQPVAIHVTFGNATDAEVFAKEGLEIHAITPRGVIRNVATSIKKLQRTGVFEIRLDRQQNTNFEVNDAVYFGGDSLIGVVRPSVTSVRIIKAGKSFKLGQVLRLNVGTGTGTAVKVTRIDKSGGIKKLKIIKFGTGYNNDSTVTIRPSSKYAVETFPDARLPLEDRVVITEQGSITKSGRLGVAWDYFREDYMHPDQYYTQAVVMTFGSGEADPGGKRDDPLFDPDAYAIIGIDTGAVIKYPGQYVSNQGFLSDPNICLHDNQFYQYFSYVLQSGVPREKYANQVKTLLHPAGMRMFSELLVNCHVDASIGIQDVSGLDIKITANDMVYGTEDHHFGIELVRDTEEQVIDTPSLHVERSVDDTVEAAEIDLPFGMYAEYDWIEDYYAAGPGEKWFRIEFVTPITINDTITATDNPGMHRQFSFNDTITIAEDKQSYGVDGLYETDVSAIFFGPSIQRR